MGLEKSDCPNLFLVEITQLGTINLLLKINNMLTLRDGILSHQILVDNYDGPFMFYPDSK